MPVKAAEQQPGEGFYGGILLTPPFRAGGSLSPLEKL